MYVRSVHVWWLRRSKMGFGNLKTESGLQALNSYLADKSYIEG